MGRSSGTRIVLWLMLSVCLIGVGVVLAGTGAMELLISTTGRLLYYPSTEAGAMRLCKQTGETNCERRWFDTNGVLRWLTTNGAAMQALTNTNKFCVQGATLQQCFYEQGGAFFSELTEISGGSRVSTVNDIPTGFTHSIRGAGNDIFVFTGSTQQVALATGATMTVPAWATTIALSADGFYMQGCTLVSDSPLVATGLIEPYITCADNDVHGFHRSFDIPDSWDGGTLTMMLSAVNVNATPTGIYEVDFSAACVRHDDPYPTTISISGEQPATMNFANACGGSACPQNDRIAVTTAAITPNGTCTGTGRMLRVQGQVDAAATTTTQTSDTKILGVKIELTRNTLKDN